ncbi:MAG: RES family NAD+ phosphorylase [Thermoanaerobaculia bacterium]
MITAWRIVDARYADNAFSGEGARKYRGRWHSAGTRIVYTASSVSLATLELLARTPRAQLLRDYAIISCNFPEAIVEDVQRNRLPENWRDFPPPPELQQLGNAWLRTHASAVLRVPSAVVEEEVNYLLNPEHAHFRSIDIGLARPFRLDFRLLT